MKKNLWLIGAVLVMLAVGGCANEKDGSFCGEGGGTPGEVTEYDETGNKATEEPEKPEGPKKPGITVNGTFYEYSAKSGISDFQNIEDKVYVYDGIHVKYYDIGGSELKTSKELEEIEIGMEDFPKDTSDFVTAYFASYYTRARNAEKSIVSKVFRINKGYETTEGLRGENTYAEAEQRGFRPFRLNEAISILDCNGEADWETAEKLANQAVAEDSFACLAHIEESFYYNLSDFWKQSYQEDDVEGLLKKLESFCNRSPVDCLIGLIAEAMEIQKIKDGEIDWFVMQAVSSYEEEMIGFLPLDIYFCTLAENVEQWDESWGLAITP